MSCAPSGISSSKSRLHDFQSPIFPARALYQATHLPPSTSPPPGPPTILPMASFLMRLLDTSDFTPRWKCGNWETGHGWLHILSDAAISAAYFAIPLSIIFYISRKRGEVSYPRLFFLFSTFIFTCGTTHLVDAIIFYHPVYRLSGLLKLLTAIASWTTLVALVRALPTALELPGLKRANDLLREQMNLREQTSRELVRSNQALSEFTDIIRSDLRDPVCSALFMADLARESADHGDQATLHEQLDLLHETLRRIDGRVKELHDKSLPSVSSSPASSG